MSCATNASVLGRSVGVLGARRPGERVGDLCEQCWQVHGRNKSLEGVAAGSWWLHAPGVCVMRRHVARPACSWRLCASAALLMSLFQGALSFILHT